MKQLPQQISQSVRRRNPHLYENYSLPEGAQPEPPVRDEPLAANQGEARNPARVLVSIVSFRVKLCDPDNLCPKYFIDCLRYAKLIQDDSPEHIILTVAQRKTRGKKNERTEIEVTRLL